MKLLRVLLVLALGMAGSGANGSNVAGLWFNSSESGWGLNLSQQAGTVFATMFVYDTNGRATWFVTPNLAQASSTTFSGDMYETTGPWFGSAFNPAAVNARKVGTMTFRSDFGITGTVTYVADGVSVVKSVERQTWRTISVAGDFRVSIINLPRASGECSGIALTAIDDVRFRDTGAITLYGSSGSPVCEISGGFAQYGDYKAHVGSIACGPGQSNFSGSVTMGDLRAEGIAGETTGTEFLTGIMFINGPAGCTKRYHFSGTRYNPS